MIKQLILYASVCFIFLLTSLDAPAERQAQPPRTKIEKPREANSTIRNDTRAPINANRNAQSSDKDRYEAQNSQSASAAANTQNYWSGKDEKSKENPSYPTSR